MDGSAAAEAKTPRFPVRALRVWPGNPRKHLEPTSIDELAAALRRDGEVRVPLFVRALEAPEGEVTHEVLAGQRRFLAAGRAGLTEVPVTVFACDDATALELVKRYLSVSTAPEPTQLDHVVHMPERALREAEVR